MFHNESLCVARSVGFLHSRCPSLVTQVLVRVKLVKAVTLMLLTMMELLFKTCEIEEAGETPSWGELHDGHE